MSSQLLSYSELLISEVNQLRRQVTILTKEKKHLEIALEAVADHEDALERQMLEVCNSQEHFSTAQLLLEVNHLRQQVTMLLKEKTQLEISLEAVAEHGDVFEEQLMEVHDLLEAEVAKRTQELEEKNRQLQQEIQERERIEIALRESEAYTRTLIRESLIGLALSRLDGSLVKVNPAFANIIGYPVEDTMKFNFWELLPKEVAISLREEMLSQLKITEHYGPYETEYLHKEGHRLPVRLAGVIVPHQGERFLWTNATDITEQKQAQIALWLAKESAEHAKTMAERANRAKTTFLANMSHELRTPLNAIIGFSDILREDMANMEYDEVIDCLRNIETAGQQLLAIISDILDITKIEAEKMDLVLQEFEVVELLNNVVTLMQPSMANNQLKVICPPKIGTVYADYMKVQQILQNLLNNAAKFTHHGKITLSVHRTDDRLVIQVTDTGIGIAPDKLEEIFKPFTQADNSYTRQYNGAGLGLTISKQLCEMMGGRIYVSSELGQGSVFTVQLPLCVNSEKLGSQKDSFLI